MADRVTRAALIERAPAKINLSLHVRGRRRDGWHDLESLVAFAGIADLLQLEPGPQLSLSVEGPMAQAAGPIDDNLVLKAARALQKQAPNLRMGRFHLLKRLPAAAGIGGGSADAAAALRLLARLNNMAPDDPRLHAAAAQIGSDVPVCLDPHARMMRGRGDELGPRLELPPLFAVLLNPGLALETRLVFGEMGYAPGEASPFGAHPEIGVETCSSLNAKLKRARNDMEDAASVLAPVIGHALSVLGAARGAAFARMSGSGATCFALFADCRAAAATAKAIRRDHPEWWTKATLLR